MTDLLHPSATRDTCAFANILRNRGRNARKLFLQKSTNLRSLGSFDHLNQRAEFDSLGMRKNFSCFRRKLIRSALELDRLVAWIDIGEVRMRIGDCSLVKIFVDGLSTLLISPFELDRNLRSMTVRKKSIVFWMLGFADHIGAILGSIHLQKNFNSRFFLMRLRNDENRLTRRHQSVHSSRRNSDPLLATAHLQSMKL